MVWSELRLVLSTDPGNESDQQVLWNRAADVISHDARGRNRARFELVVDTIFRRCTFYYYLSGVTLTFSRHCLSSGI